MIISLDRTLPCDKDIKFQAWLFVDMADSMFMFAVTTGIFVFLVAICFGARAKRYSSGFTSSGGHAEIKE
jgi:hypothetical protein